MNFKLMALIAVLSTNLQAGTHLLSLDEMQQNLQSGSFQKIQEETTSDIPKKLPKILGSLQSIERDLLVPQYPVASSISLVIHAINRLAEEGQSEINRKDLRRTVKVLVDSGQLEIAPEYSKYVDHFLNKIDKVTIEKKIKGSGSKKREEKSLTFHGVGGNDIELKLTKEEALKFNIMEEYSDLDYTFIIEDGAKFKLGSLTQKESLQAVKELKALEKDEVETTAGINQSYWEQLKSSLNQMKQIQPGIAENCAQYFSSHSQNAILVKSDDIYLRVNVAKIIDSDSGNSFTNFFVPEKLNVKIHPEKILVMTGIKNYRTEEQLSPLVFYIQPAMLLPQIIFSVQE